jgi:two-component system chemotaxis sensor kinase CheA
VILHPLVLRQLREAFPDGVPDVPGLDALVASTGDAYAAADDDRRQLESSIQLISDELLERNARLEHQIAELTRLETDVLRRTAELDWRNHDMSLILDHVAQGFATVALDGSIGHECSRAFTRWFGAQADDARIWTHLAGHDPNVEAWILLGFESLQSGVMPTDVVIDQLPPRIDRDGRQFRVEYRPIGEPLTGFLVVVSDITDELVRQHEEAAQRELFAVVENAYRDRTGFLAFIRETNELVRHSETTNIPLAELQREVHTVKGNSAMFGALSVSEICHDLESQMEHEGIAPDRAAWASLIETWRAFHDRVDNLLGLSQRRAVLVDWDEYQSVLASLDDPERSWAVRIRRWGQDPTRVHLERFADQARQLAQRLGKAELDVEIRDNGVSVETDRFAPMWSALVHAVRNAVDHGIEPTAQRVANGKPPRARLTLTTELRGSELVIEIQDDGGGVDWQAVATRAAALGLPSATARELSVAVFANGLSTARELTQTSGRGLGMTALRTTCAELGGRVELTSEQASGTTVRCFVPLARSKSRTRGTTWMRS